MVVGFSFSPALVLEISSNLTQCFVQRMLKGVLPRFSSNLKELFAGKFIINALVASITKRTRTDVIAAILFRTHCSDNTAIIEAVGVSINYQRKVSTFLQTKP